MQRRRVRTVIVHILLVAVVRVLEVPDFVRDDRARAPVEAEAQVGELLADELVVIERVEELAEAGVGGEREDGTDVAGEGGKIEVATDAGVGEVNADAE